MYHTLTPYSLPNKCLVSSLTSPFIRNRSILPFHTAIAILAPYRQMDVELSIARLAQWAGVSRASEWMELQAF